MDGYSQEEDGMAESDTGALAIGENPKVIHMGVSVAEEGSRSRDLPNPDL
jgi:hypothetical protein